jgi:glutaredoxin
MSENETFDSGQPLHVRLYGRTGCHLCQDAAQLLNTLHTDYDFWVERVNIDEDPIIKEKLNDHIPVVTFNGVNRVQDPVTEEKLRRAFKKALAVEEKDHETAVETSN